MNQRSNTVLHENDFGNVSKCSCCRELQLHLGNIVLHFSEKEFYRFDQFFDRIRKDFSYEKPTKSKKRKYIIVTDQKGLVLALSYPELKQTIELLNFTSIMLSVNKLTGIYEE